LFVVSKKKIWIFGSTLGYNSNAGCE